MNITREGELFIINEETGGQSYYEKIYKSTFIWPEGFSGCTALVGIDIGYYTVGEVDEIFKPFVSVDDLKLIQGGRGLVKTDAKNYVSKLQHINLPWDTAIKVFDKFTLPKFTTLTLKVFPGVESLCASAQAALLSIVFNRGGSLRGDSRAEMREIRDLVASVDYKKMAASIRSMKRLWSPSSGLVGRREREARLVEKCLI
jgi:hypothetical protein